MVFIAELRRFCETTSMKGVSRAVNQKNSSALRVMWSVAVFLLFGYVCYQSYMLLDDFFQYHVITSSKEGNPNLHMSPVITLCTMRHIPASKQAQHPDVTSAAEYIKLIGDMMVCQDGEDCEHIESLRVELWSISGYISYIGLHNASLISHSADGFVLNCYLTVARGITIRTIPCGDFFQIQRHYVLSAFTCFDFSRNPNSNTTVDGYVYGLDLLIYVDSAAPYGLDSLHRMESSKSGILGSISSHGVRDISSLEMTGFHIPIGSHVEVETHPLVRSREGPPYGDCRNYSDLKDLTGEQACHNKCFEKIISQMCECQEPESPISKETPLDDRPFCLDAKLPREAVIENINCRREAMRPKTCFESCPPSCTEVRFKPQIHSNPWPGFDDMNDIYNSYIKGSAMEPKFAAVGDALSLNCSSEFECLWKLNRASLLLKSNFARVSVKQVDRKVLYLVDSKKTTVVTLMSTLGGALNLWSGISAMLILEILEVIYRLLSATCRMPKVSPQIEMKQDA
ncbi:hypothetical protein CAPTEDRAFT_203499 [Capitella teleta]|uniref:Uncharacterized protein n=1 Tax=Capitella teleta TaxID=283909 RepID=R7VEQ1_CAPTE|nr:hypothetical protein CAPTEDRAFT_203499 [Capitella teleta]|eukprot:ELU14145.1 hypothetical protein CAPTEDRAFT_203499 [Capitella teleta]